MSSSSFRGISSTVYLAARLVGGGILSGLLLAASMAHAQVGGDGNRAWMAATLPAPEDLAAPAIPSVEAAA